ncbi:ActD-like protein, partial [Myxococcus sp. 1LA]
MTSPHRTPDWLLERIALGELSPGELAAARAGSPRTP